MTGRAGRARGMVDVVLDGEDDVDPPPDPRAGARSGAGRRPRLVAVLAVSAVVAVVGVANWLESYRAAAEAAAAAAIPGVVGPLVEPLGAAWQASTALGVSEGGDLVLRWQERVGGLQLEALDPASGKPRWSVPRSPDGVDWCEGAAGDPTDPVVLCWQVSPPAGAPVGTGILVALSAADGSVVAEHTVRLPSSGYGVVDGDVVLGYREGRSVQVTRLDPVSGQEVWRTGYDLSASQSDGAFSAWLRVDHDVVVVSGPTTAVLRGADGDVLGRWDAPPDGDEAGFPSTTDGAEVAATADGFGVWPDVAAGTRSDVGSWYDLDGERLATVTGFLAEPTVSDGSVPELLLTRPTGGGLTAVERRTGEVRWSVPLEGGATLLRRQGAVVLADARRVFAVDLRSGTEQWAAPLPGLRPDLGSVTDGLRVVVLAQQGEGWAMRAIGSDGVPLWSSALPVASGLPPPRPEGFTTLTAIGGTPVTSDGQVMIGLGGG